VATDGWGIHCLAIAEQSKLIELFIPQGYCSELNPDELLNQELKATVFETVRLTSKAKLSGKLCFQNQPLKIQAYLQKGSVR